MMTAMQWIRTTGKKPYSKPVLTKYGSLTITRGSAPHGKKDAPHACAKTQ